MKAVVLGLALLLGGCVGPAAKVESPAEALLVSVIAIKNLAVEAEMQYRQGRLNSEQKVKVLTALETAQVSAQSAKVALALGDNNTALVQLQAIRAVLRTVEDILRGQRDTGTNTPERSRYTPRPADNGWVVMATVRRHEGRGGRHGPENIVGRCRACA